MAKKTNSETETPETAASPQAATATIHIQATPQAALAATNVPHAQFKNISRRVLMLQGTDRILPEQIFTYADTPQMQRLCDRKILVKAELRTVYDDEGNIMGSSFEFP